MDTYKSTHPIYVIILGAETVMFVAYAYAFAKLLEKPHRDQRRVVGFAPNFNTVHTYKMIQQTTILQRDLIMYAWIVKRRFR